MPIPLLLHGKHTEPADVVYEPLGPWIVPWRLGSFEDEYRVLRAGVGLLDYSTQALIQVSGADRASFLHNLLTNDIQRLSPGSGCQAALLTASAKVIATLLVFADVDSLWLMCEATRAATVAQTLDRYHFSEQVSLTNRERQQAVLALQGPRTMDALAQLTGEILTLPRTGQHARATIDGMPVRLIRSDLAGNAGVLCFVAADQAEALWTLVQTKGRRSGVRPVGWEALNVARIEAGVPWYGVDMDEEQLLPETGLEAVAVSDTKGCYLGQEIIARLATYGSVNKKLMGLLIEGDQVPASADRILRNGEEVGRVTSACRSPALKRPIAMGYLKRGAYDASTTVEIMRATAHLVATVTTLPMVAATNPPASSSGTRAGGRVR